MSVSVHLFFFFSQIHFHVKGLQFNNLTCATSPGHVAMPGWIFRLDLSMEGEKPDFPAGDGNALPEA